MDPEKRPTPDNLSERDKRMMEINPPAKEIKEGFVSSAVPSTYVPETFDDIQNPYLKQYIESGGPSQEMAKRRAGYFSPEINLKEGKKGEIGLRLGDYRVRFSYRPLDFSTLNYDQSYLLNQLGGNKLIEVTDFVMTKKGVVDKKGKPRTLNFPKILPQGFRVFINPKEKGTSKANIEQRLCLVNGDFLSPENFLALVHEASHGKDYENRKKHFHNSPDEYAESRRQLTTEGPVEESVLEEALRKERNTWAYVLREIRPFMDKKPYQPKSGLFGGKPRHYFSLDKKTVLGYIHDYCLSTYSDAIRKRVEAMLYKDSADDWDLEHAGFSF